MDFAQQLAQFNPDPALVAWVSAQLAQAEQQAKDLVRKEQDLQRKDLKIQQLTLELAYYRRIRFGKKSEALPAEQRDLFEETKDVDIAAIEAEVAAETESTQPDEQRKRAKPTGRKRLPPELPRVDHHHEPASCDCGKCGSHLVKIGEDISEQLDIEPGRFFVHRHIRSQYACRACETITAEPVPPAVIDGSLAAPGLLAWVVIQKFLDHLPLYRIEGISARHGVPISRSTLAEWVGRIGVALQPLADALTGKLRQQTILHADETPVQQLDVGAGKTKRAYMWVYRSNDLSGGPPIVVFDYQTSRSGSHARAFLQGWRGHLMVDDYSGYKAMFGAGITELGCLAHARRKFFDLHAANGNPIAAQALQRIAELYAIEQGARNLGIDERKALRQEKAAPKLLALREWLINHRLNTADGSGLARAIDYSLRRWEALARYADSGDLPIDNNPAENAVRPIALGRKNWLFIGSERAGRRAAAIQSLLATAKLNGLEPYAWLKDVLEKLPLWPNSRIDELLPLRMSD